MLDHAVSADRLGFDAVSITEHHLINILLMPAPLPFAVKIAGVTGRVKIITSVVVLPLHDMRILAGQLVCTDIFTDGRLLLTGERDGGCPPRLNRASASSCSAPTT